MRWLGLAYIWMVAIRDTRLTMWMVKQLDPAAETNAFARMLIESFGAGALPLLKLAAVAVFTTTVILASRKRPVLGTRLLAAGVVVSVGLSAWWDAALMA